MVCLTALTGGAKLLGQFYYLGVLARCFIFLTFFSSKTDYILVLWCKRYRESGFYDIEEGMRAMQNTAVCTVLTL